MLKRKLFCRGSLTNCVFHVSEDNPFDGSVINLPKVVLGWGVKINDESSSDIVLTFDQMTGDDGRLVIRCYLLENLLLTSLRAGLSVAVGLQSFFYLVDFDLLLEGNLKDVVLTLA